MTDITESVKFKIKLINWSLDYNDSVNPISTPILLQDKNGPCPLIALVNTLMLNNDLQLSKTDTIHSQINQTKSDAILHFKSELLQHEHVPIDLDVVLKHLGDLLLTFVEQNDITGSKFEIDQLLNNLPLLHTGLTVNPNLITGEFNSEDLSTNLFNIFDLKFRHGWVINQIDNENIEWNEILHQQETTLTDNYSHLVELFNDLQTFDRIQDYLLLDSSKDPQILTNQKLINKWLDLNCTQLTSIGLDKLNYSLNNEEFMIFFRNNHFNTLFKKSNHEFYILITDTSFQSNKSSSKIIWQSLNSISGHDDLFFTANFLPILDIDQDVRHEEQHNDIDYLLSKHLQEQEDEALAKRMQQSYNKATKRQEQATKAKQTQPIQSKPKGATTTTATTTTATTTTATTTSAKKKKKNSCIII